MINDYVTRIDIRFVSKKRREQSNTYRSCKGPWIKWYEQFHAKSLLKRNSADRISSRFLVYLCHGQQQGCGGLGNRIKAIVSLFYLAMLTNRVFLIHWGGPEKLENFLQPNTINWTYDERLLQDFKRHQRYWGVWSSPQGYDDSRIEEYPKFLNWTKKENFDVILNQDVESIGTIWYFADQIWKNPHLAKRAEEMGLPPVQSDFPFAMLGCGMDFLFKKSAFVENKLSQARKNLMIRPRPYIGIHIRTSDYHFGDPNPYSIRTKNPERVLECAERVQTLIQAKKSIGKRPITWFLAADDVKIKQKWVKKFPLNVFSLKMTPQHFEYSGGDTIAFCYALVDIFLLSESDYFIGSWDSTFTHVAIGIRGFSTKSLTYGERCHINQTGVELAN